MSFDRLKEVNVIPSIPDNSNINENTHTHTPTQHNIESLSSTNCHPSMLNRYLATTSSNTTEQILRFYDDVNTALPIKYMHDHINSIF